MKKVALFLLAVVMVAGFAGCSDDDKLTAADLAGTYTLVSFTSTPAGGSPQTFTPPSYAGTLTLTSSGTWTATSTSPRGPDMHSGTFTVDDPIIIATDPTSPNASITGVISDDNRTITMTWKNPDGWVGVSVYAKS